MSSLLLLYPVKRTRENAFVYSAHKAMAHRAANNLLSQSIVVLLRLQRTTNTQRIRRNLPIVCTAHARRAKPHTQGGLRLSHPAVGHIKEYIDEHYSEPLTLGALAQIARISPFHLLRVFRDAEGTTPSAYLADVRIHNARTMLERGCSLAETALATGFYDQSHFTNAFRRATGTTPKQYQQKSKILQEKEV